MSDSISRQAAIRWVKTECNPYGKPTLDFESGKKVIEHLEQMPSADRPQGEWKRRLVDNGFNADWICSECGYRVKTDFVSFNFCPNCGADMRKGADDEHDK